MSQRSEQHECEVCGTYGFHGFKQADGEYLWYCFLHRLVAYTNPNPLPPQPAPPEPQGELLFDVKIDREDAFRRYDGRDWSTRFMAFLRYLINEGETGTAEHFRFKAERRIGKPHDDHLVGAVILRAAGEGLFERAGHGRMRSKKAHGRETPLWRRTRRI